MHSQCGHPGADAGRRDAASELRSLRARARCAVRASTAGPGLDTAEMDALAGSGPLASRDKIRPPDTIVTPLVPWLLAAALALALLEILGRRGSAPLWSALDDESSSESAA